MEKENINIETIKEAAKVYGFTVEKVKNKDDAGFYINDKKVEFEDIFPELYRGELGESND